MDNSFYNDIINNVGDGIYFLNTDRVITYWNKAAERITGFKSQEVVGSRCQDNVLTHVSKDGVQLCDCNLCPAYKSIVTGKTIEADEVYLHHKDGQRVCISLRTSPIYDNNGLITGATQIFRNKQTNVELQKELEHLRHLSLIDPLTNVGNRRFAEISLKESFNQLSRYNWPFGVLFFDIDHFKKVNDNYGHQTGDKILQMLACTVSEATRSFDKIARWGGEEFIAIILNTNADNLFKIAEKLKLMVEESYLILDGRKISITVSIGATVSNNYDTPTSLIERADSLMYKSKKQGRNTITVS